MKVRAWQVHGITHAAYHMDIIHVPNDDSSNLA